MMRLQKDYHMFSDLIGKVITQIDGGVQENEMIFTCSNGERYKMYHEQDCCEGVSIEDITGDLNDLLHTPILQAEETGTYEENAYGEESWTFYKLATVKGYVTIRWYGSSNGYYSTAVSFEKE